MMCHGGAWPSFVRRGPADRPFTIEPVYGAVTVFSLPAACEAAGLLPGCAARQAWPDGFSREAKAAFGGDVDQFLGAAYRVGFTSASFDEAADRIAAAHVCYTAHGIPASRMAVCTDLALTVAVLSRRVGSVILRDRPPILTWEQLFGGNWAISEPTRDTQPQVSAAWEAVAAQYGMGPLL